MGNQSEGFGKWEIRTCPPAPESRLCVSPKESRKISVSLTSFAISALAWKPYTSGAATRGRESMYSCLQKKETSVL
jgi:hypothetical protein